MFLSKKKALSLILALAMMASLLSGCSGQTTPTSSTPAASSSNVSEPEVVQSASDETWPNGSIQLVVSSGFGITFDRTLRNIASFLSYDQYLGTSVVVLNKTAGAGVESFEYALSQPNDMNTLMGLTAPNMLQAMQSLGKKPEDFAFLGSVCDEPGAIAVPADSPINSFADLIEELKAHPGELVMGTVRNSPGELMMKNICALCDIPEPTYVEYPNASEKRLDQFAGMFDFTSETFTGCREYADELKVLAQTMTTEQELLPGVAPAGTLLKEMGYDISLDAFTLARGLVCTKEAYEQYPERFDKIVEALKALYEDEDFMTLNSQSLLEVNWIDGDEFESMTKTLYYDVLDLG